MLSSIETSPPPPAAAAAAAAAADEEEEEEDKGCFEATEATAVLPSRGFGTKGMRARAAAEADENGG